MDEKQYEILQKDVDNLKNVALVFNKTLQAYEKRIATLEQGGVLSSSIEKSPSEKNTTTLSYADEDKLVIDEDALRTSSQSVPHESSALSMSAFEWLAIDWPMKVGAFLLLLGMGWFVSYAFVNNWIGPIGRITLGIVLGVSVLSVGQWRLRTFIDQGSVLMGLGGVIIFLVIFAARTVYDFFTPFSALASMFVVIAYIAYISVLYRSLALSIVSLCAGGIAPLLVASGEENFVGLFSYLLVLVSGALLVASKTGQRILILLSLMGVFFYSMPYVFSIKASENAYAFAFALLFAGLFFVASFTAMLRNGRVDREDLAISGCNSILLLLWIRAAVADEWQSFVSLTIAFVLSLIAYAIARNTPNAQSFSHTRFASALLFLVAATVFEFSGDALIIAFLIEIVALFFIAKKGLEDGVAARQISVLLVVPTVMSWDNVVSYASSDTLFSVDFFVIAFTIGALTTIGIALRNQVIQEGILDQQSPKKLGVLLIAAFVYTILFVWLIFHTAQSQTMATFLSLVTYTLVGGILYVKGKISQNTQAIYLGGSLFAFVVARLILVDVWEMSLAARIATFFIVGILFMSTAFVGNTKKDVINL